MKEKYLRMKIIYNEMTSGILFKERIREYKRFIDYLETDEGYKAGIEAHLFSELDLKEVKRIAAFIDCNEEYAIDSWGRYLKVYSKEIFNEDNVYLVKKPNRLYYLSTEKDLRKLIKKKDGYQMNFEKRFMIEYERNSNKENVTVLGGRSIFETWGTIYIYGIEERGPNDYKVCNIKYDDVIGIVGNTNFILDKGIIDLFQV